MNPSGKILEIFDKNPNSIYEFSDLQKLIGGDYKTNYNALQYIVKCKCVVKKRSGRKCTYFKRTREYNEKRSY